MQLSNYKVIATVSTRNDTNVATISVKNKLKLTLPNTGGMDQFKEVNFGTLKLLKGINTINFTGGKKKEVWDFVRLKNIKLIRVN